MADHSNFLTLANRLIDKHGMTMTFVRVVADGELNLVTGKRVETVEDVEFIGVRTRPTKSEIETGHFQGVSTVILAAGDALPLPTIADRLRFDGHDWEITEVYQVAPSDLQILYKLGVKDAGNV